MVYHDTAQVPWIEKSEKEVRESSRTAEQRNIQGLQDGAVRDEKLEQGMGRFGVRIDGNEDREEQGTSSQESNDFDVIV